MAVVLKVRAVPSTTDLQTRHSASPLGTTLVSGLIGLALAPLIVPAIYLTLLVVYKLLVKGLGACSDAVIHLVPGKKNDDK